MKEEKKLPFTDEHPDNNPLHNQILGRNPEEACKLLDETNSDLLKQWLGQSPLENTPLLLAIKTGAFDVALALIKKHIELNVPVNAQDNQGMSALHWAAFFRNDVLIDVLVKETNADIDLKSKPIEEEYGFGLKAIDFYTMKNDVLYEHPTGEIIDGDKVSLLWTYGKPIIEEEFNISFYNQIKNLAFHMDSICCNLNLATENDFKGLLATRSSDYYHQCYKKGAPLIEEYRASIPRSVKTIDLLRGDTLLFNIAPYLVQEFNNNALKNLGDLNFQPVASIEALHKKNAKKVLDKITSLLLSVHNSYASKQNEIYVELNVLIEKNKTADPTVQLLQVFEFLFDKYLGRLKKMGASSPYIPVIKEIFLNFLGQELPSPSITVFWSNPSGEEFISGESIKKLISDPEEKLKLFEEKANNNNFPNN